MSEVPADRPDHERTPIVPLLLLLVVVLVLLEHLRAWFAPASFEHLAQIVQQLAAVDGGRGPQDEQALVTGGGGLVLWLHWIIRELGLPYDAMHGLYAMLDVIAVVAWVLVARRWLDAPMLWCSALALALYETPKFYLVENSTLMAFSAPALLACLVTALRRDSMVWLAASAGLLALSTHLGLLALFALPVTLFAVWRGGFSRWKAASALLVIAALLPVLPIWSAGDGNNPVFEELLFRFQPGRIVPTLLGITGYLGSFLIEAFLLLGLVALVVAPRALRRSVPTLGLATAWLLATAVPAAILDPFEEPYHFAMASPARALIAGFGLFALGTGLRRLTRERLTWTATLAGVALVAIAGSLLTTGWAATHPERALADGDLDAPCAAWDQGCHRHSTTRLLELLDDGGLLPPPEQPVSFHGVAQGCLDAAWYWRHSQRVDDPGAFAGEPHHLLLLAPGEGTNPLDLPGAVDVDGWVAIAGAEPLAWYDDWDVQPDPPYRIELPDTADDLIYVGLDSSRTFSAGTIEGNRGGPAVAPSIRCDNTRDEALATGYDGFFVLDAGLAPGDGPFVVVIDTDVDGTWPPENVDVLRLPRGGAAP